MAQTKRKRRTKHRGNAAGVVEARGRTGRKPTASEKAPARGSSGAARGGDARARREERMNRPPTWRAALNRALIAAAVLFAVSILLLHQSVAGAAVLLPFVLLIYAPLGYYTDLFMYRRRMRQKGVR
jgi:hypothetical protein